jgi:hypothetical protein
MMQTAFNISDVTFSTVPLAGKLVSLAVSFRIYNHGPSHVAGLVVTTDLWVTSKTVQAVFKGSGAGFELWQASFSAPGPRVTFEFVVFCDDYGGLNAVPRIWNTNGGNRYRAKA